MLFSTHCCRRWWCRPDLQSPLVTIPNSNPASSPPVSTNNAASGHTTVHPAKSKLAELKRRLLVALLTVTFYYYPSYLTTALSLFECYHIDPTSQQAEQYYPENAQVPTPALKRIMMLMVLHSGSGTGGCTLLRGCNKYA